MVSIICDLNFYRTTEQIFASRNIFLKAYVSILVEISFILINFSPPKIVLNEKLKLKHDNAALYQQQWEVHKIC